MINLIDPNQLISHRLFRNHCYIENSEPIKDLRKLGRKLEDLIIVDDSKHSFQRQPENGILIKPFFNDINDIELKKLFPILEIISKIDDVREYIRKYRLNEENSFEFCISRTKHNLKIPDKPLKQKNYTRFILKNAEKGNLSKNLSTLPSSKKDGEMNLIENESKIMIKSNINQNLKPKTSINHSSIIDNEKNKIKKMKRNDFQENILNQSPVNEEKKLDACQNQRI